MNLSKAQCVFVIHFHSGMRIYIWFSASDLRIISYANDIHRLYYLNLKETVALEMATSPS